MKVERSTVTKLTIKNIPHLDPVSVILEDIGLRQGKVIIECFGESWTANWGGIGARTVQQFFASCSSGYLVGCLDRGCSAIITDKSRLQDWLKETVLQRRRDGDFTRQQARELWDEVNDRRPDDVDHYDDLIESVVGPEWWHCLPQCENPRYVYLTRIVKAVQEAMNAKTV